MNHVLSKVRRVVIKLGTGVLTSGIGQLDTERIATMCGAIHRLREKGLEVIIVSSGAIGLGMGRLGLKKRPTDIATLQACAAVGQSMLTETWQNGFVPWNIIVAQLLFTHDNFRSRNRHLAARDIFEKLLSEGIVPVVNENDAITCDEIRFGDNDTLSALVASLTRADLLIILSTVKGLLDMENGKKLIPVVEAITPEIEALAGGTDSPTAVGGMKSKITAAKIATRSGCGMFIGSGAAPELLDQMFFQGNPEGTFFLPQKIPMSSRRRWIAFFDVAKGTVTVDDGARKALVEQGKSLLAGGVKGCQGHFRAGDMVNIAGQGGEVFARGVCAFSAEEILHVAGKTSRQVKELFPYRKQLEVIHRDSLALLG